MNMTEEQHVWPPGCQDRPSMMNKQAWDSLKTIIY